MKVIYLNPSGQMGGAEWSLINLLSGLKEQPDFRPYVVVPEVGPLVEHCRHLEIATEILPFPTAVETMGDSRYQGGRFGKLGAFFTLIRGFQPGCEYLGGLKALLRRVRPDVIHTNGFKMHLAGAWAHYNNGSLRRTPLVGHVHDYVSTRPIAGRALRTAVPRFSRFIANSRSVADDIQVFLRTQKVQTIHNAIDTGRFSAEGEVMDLDRQCGLEEASPGTVRVGLVATFARWKGHLTFLQALAKIDSSVPIRGYIIGGPIYRTAGSQFTMDELQAEVNRLNIRGKVGFTGFIPDTVGAVRALDIVVHASTKPEPFGMSIVEAMACRKAVVVSDLGGARELFEENRTALGHRPGDSDQLAGKIALLAGCPAFRSELGTRASASVRSRFEKSKMALNFRRVYESVINESVGAQR